MTSSTVISSPGFEDASRKMKRIQTDKNDWEAEIHKEIRKQKQMMSTLQKDNEQLKQQVMQAQASGFGITRSSAASSSTGKLQPVQPTSGSGRRMQKVKVMDNKKENVDNTFHLVNICQNKKEDLYEQIEETKGQLGVARKAMGGINITKENTTLVSNQVRVLESRLDKSLIKFNEALHINKTLRDEIDSLRRERAVFDTIYKKLERELQEKKKEMAYIIEVSNIAYEERDNAQSELAQLKAYASKELNSFDETFKELDELLEEDRKMKDSIRQRMLEQSKMKRDSLPKSPGLNSEDEASPGGRKKTKKGALSSAVSAPDLTRMSASEDTPKENYEEAFNKIKTATNMSDVNALVNKFVHSEDVNFSLFNYVNELNNEIEKLEEAREELKVEITRVKGNVHGQGDSSRKALLKQLEENLQQEEANTRKFQQLTEQTTKTLEDIMASVDKLFTRLECDERIVLEQHGVAGLSENTLQLYLAAIELKSDFLQSCHRENHGGAERGPAFPIGGSAFSVDIPTTGDEYNEGNSDEEDRVLSRTELLQKTNAKLFKQQQQATAEGRKTKRPTKQKKTQVKE
jgi:hypothetical protein